MLTNQSGSAVVDVPYRVTITGAGKTLAVTKGDDTINPYVTLAGHEARIVVVEPRRRLKSKPTAATVRTYTGHPAGGVAVPEPAQWRVTNQRIRSSDHEVTADLTNAGRQSAVLKTVTAVVRRGHPGPIIAAGVLNLTTTGQAVAPGETLPVGGEVTGNLPRVPSGLVVEFSVQPSAPRGD